MSNKLCTFLRSKSGRKFNLRLFSTSNFSKLCHPSDSLHENFTNGPKNGKENKKLLKFPKTDDFTEWINDDLPEYPQVRQRLRKESADHFESATLLPFENRFRSEMLQKKFKYRSDFEGENDKEALWYTKKFFESNGAGETKTSEKNSEKPVRIDTKINTEKTGRLCQRLRIESLGMFDGELPLKAKRQIKKLISYIDAKNVDEYYYKIKDATLMASNRLLAVKEKMNELILRRQKQQMAEFEEDSLRLIEESEGLKKRLGADKNTLKKPLTQALLQKWHLLKIDFSSKHAGEGIVVEPELEIGAGKGGTMTKREVLEHSGYNFARVIVDEEEGLSEHCIGKKQLEEIRRDTLDLSKAQFSYEEAMKLLSDESVLALIEAMKGALEKAHKLLLIKNPDQETEKGHNDVNLNLTQNGKTEMLNDHIERMKNARMNDPAIELRLFMRDDLATKKQRLTRNFYDELKSKAFRKLENTLALDPLSKEDFLHLNEIKDISMSTVTVHNANLPQNSINKRILERKVVLKVPLKEFDGKTVFALRQIFPNLVNNKEKMLIVTSKAFSMVQVNKKIAFETLSKIIHEAKLFKVLKYPKTIGMYVERLERLKENKENLKKLLPLGVEWKEIPSKNELKQVDTMWRKEVEQEEKEQKDLLNEVKNSLSLFENAVEI